MIGKQEIIKKLHDLGDALDRQSTDDLTGGDTCYIAADLIKKLSAECDHLEKQLAESERRAEEKNEPLSLDELREMDGEPVYIITGAKGGHWELSADAEEYLMDRDEDFYGMTCGLAGCSQPCHYGLHQLGWLAYKRKPKGE